MFSLIFGPLKLFLPEMIAKNEGHICTIASAAGLFGAPKMIDYCSSKFAAIGFDESLRLELHKLGKNIETTVICPTHINTPLFKGFNPGLLQSLSPQYVAEMVLEAIQQNKKVVYLPRLVYVSNVLKSLLPTFLQDLSTKLAGVSTAMDSFQGNSNP